MPLLIYTSRHPHKGSPGYTGPGGLDVTRGTGGAYGGVFAPSRQLLDEANRRKRAAHGDEAKLVAAWEWYAPLYRAEMRGSWSTHHHQWLQLLRRQGEITLLCYCRTWQRCHRRLLVEYLVAAGRQLHLDVRDAGERDLGLDVPAPKRQPGEDG